MGSGEKVEKSRDKKLSCLNGRSVAVSELVLNSGRTTIVCKADGLCSDVGASKTTAGRLGAG